MIISFQMFRGFWKIEACTPLVAVTVTSRLLTHLNKNSSIKEIVTHKIPMVPSQYMWEHAYTQYAQYTLWFSLMHTFTSHTHPPTQICIHSYHRHILYLCFAGNKMKAYQEKFNLFKSSSSIFSAPQKFLALWYNYMNCSSYIFWTFFSVTTIFFCSTEIFISYNYVVMCHRILRLARCGPC